MADERCFLTSANIRAFYAENNKMNQLILQKMLGKIEQIKLEVVDDGQLALEALGAKSFDLVLMDLQMPNMDGYEACEIIRGGGVGEIYQGIPIIAITADATFETKQRVLALGMDDYMTKPVDKDALVSRIFELCGRERAAS